MREAARAKIADHGPRLPRLAVVAAYALLVVLWGSIFAAVKVGIEVIPPFVFAFDRALAVASLLTAASFALHQPWPRDSHVILAAIGVGVTNGVNWSIIFWAQQYVPSGLTALFGASAPIWTALFAHFLIRDDRLSVTKIFGLLFGLAGVLVLVGTPNLGGRSEALVAGGLLAVAPVAAATMTIIQSRALRQGSSIPLVAISMWVCALILFPFRLGQMGEQENWSTQAVLAFGYLVIFSSCVGLVLALWLTRRLRPTTMVLVQVLIPAEAVFIGAAAFGETVTPWMLAGALLVCIAVGLNALAGPGRAPRPPVSASPAD